MLKANFHEETKYDFQNSGFDDAFKLLDRLSLYVFDLPVNLAVQQFQQMEEAF